MINGVNQWLLFRAIRPEVVLVVTMTATIAAIVEERKQYCTADELSLVVGTNCCGSRWWNMQRYDHGPEP